MTSNYTWEKISDVVDLWCQTVNSSNGENNLGINQQKNIQLNDKQSK